MNIARAVKRISTVRPNIQVTVRDSRVIPRGVADGSSCDLLFPE